MALLTYTVQVDSKLTEAETQDIVQGAIQRHLDKLNAGTCLSVLPLESPTTTAPPISDLLAIKSCLRKYEYQRTRIQDVPSEWIGREDFNSLWFRSTGRALQRVLLLQNGLWATSYMYPGDTSWSAPHRGDGLLDLEARLESIFGKVPE